MKNRYEGKWLGNELQTFCKIFYLLIFKFYLNDYIKSIRNIIFINML